MASSRRWLRLTATALLLLVTFAAGWILAKTGVGSGVVDPATLPERELRFEQRMRNVSMVGYFTVDGREDRLTNPDRYDISSIEKIGEDRWRFNARIGELNVTIPIVVTMRWVEDTPMIMLTNLTVPPLGTFSVRVFFYGNRYSGTWQHGVSGGHMFGRIEQKK